MWFVATLAFLVPLGFAAFTQHAWEDYYITLRSSRNLVEGHGLVFNAGERLHTFTSPLGVLVSALCTAITGVGHEQAALWLFRLINAVLLGGTALLAWRRFDTLGVGAIGRAVFFGLVLADAKLTDFAISGMETAMLVFFVVLFWSELESPDKPRAGVLGLAAGGLMWTRPDAFILAGALALPHLVFAHRADGTRRIAWRELATGALFGGLIYVPWFAWAWWYYGSPIPHTIIAKAQITPPVDWHVFLMLPWWTLTGRSILMDLFTPTYAVYGGWPHAVETFGWLLTTFAAFAWIAPRGSAPLRRASLAVFIGMFYVCVIVLFPWYDPPWMVLTALVLALSADVAATRGMVATRPWAFSALRILAAAVVAIQAAIFAGSAWEMRVQQRIIENGVRGPIGHWLHEVAAPTDTVFLEPLGYIGYYSALKTYDYPGLSSPEVVAAIHDGDRRLTEVIARLHPTWLVLRPHEFANPAEPRNAALRDYELVRVWNVRAQLDAVRLLPGRPWLEFDSEFRIYHRKPVPASLATPARRVTNAHDQSGL